MSARLFVAVEVAEGDRAALHAWATAVVGDDRGMRVVGQEQLHLTLAFLGHRPLDEIEPLSALVAGWEGHAAPALRTAGALWLSPRRPHVLTVAVDDASGALGAVHAGVWDALEELGHERESRRYRPHLTVARVRHGWTAPRDALAPAPERSLTATGLTLFRSWLGGGPARYEALSRAPFSTGL
jgi:RNA 2',3'-cyclic 3'-phosphodiesterase